MEKEILIDIDEFTLVLRPKGLEFDYQEWPIRAMEIINSIELLSSLVYVLGPRKPLETPPQGYKIAYTFGDYPFYLAIAYHPKHILMGVIVKFSATAWATYQHLYNSKFNKQIYLYSFLQKLDRNELYNLRLSRVDITFDYFNFNISVDGLYKGLLSKPQLIRIRDSKNRINRSKISGILVNNVINTFYLGSRKANVNLLLRIYDKKLEQLETKGNYLQTALGNNSWIRFEMVLKGKYAHQITDYLLTINSYSEFQLYLVNLFLEKFQFYQVIDNQEYLSEITNQLFTKLGNITIISTLSLPRPVNNKLSKTIIYLLKNSGLISFLYKIKILWGYEAINIFLEFIQEYLDNRYLPTEDLGAWLTKYKDDYKKRYIDEILTETILLIESLEKGDD